VIDATGTIYVLGGGTGYKNVNDVWRSTDGGEAGHATGAASVMIVLRGEWSYQSVPMVAVRGRWYSE
jgi:hypothetical protein